MNNPDQNSLKMSSILYPCNRCTCREMLFYFLFVYAASDICWGASLGTLGHRFKPMTQYGAASTSIGRSTLSGIFKSPQTSMSCAVNSVNLTVACVSWNLQELTPSLADCKFLHSFCSQDLVVVGVQECESLRPRRREGRRSRALQRLLSTTLGDTQSCLSKLNACVLFIILPSK